MNTLAVSIDWLNLTVPNGDVDAILREVGSLLGEQHEKMDGGFRGYSNRIQFPCSAVVAYGGIHQRGTVFVSLSGAACARIARLRDVRTFFEPLGARITRVDVAADDFQSEMVSVSGALDAWREGAFSLQRRPPKASYIDDCGSNAGRTLYVGSRDSGKLCRVYDKGKALGDKLSKWVRAEVEWHAKDRVIPWDILSEPVRYLAGAYPFFERFSLTLSRVMCARQSLTITIERLREWIRLAAGKGINALLEVEGGDLGALVASVRRDGVPERLRMLLVPGGPRLGELAT